MMNSKERNLLINAIADGNITGIATMQSQSEGIIPTFISLDKLESWLLATYPSEASPIMEDLTDNYSSNGIEGLSERTRKRLGESIEYTKII